MNKIKNLIFGMLCILVIMWIRSSSLVYAADVSVTLRFNSDGILTQPQQVMISNSGDFFNNETGIQNRGNSNDGKWINYTLVSGHNYMEVDNWKLADGNWISDNNWDHSSNLRRVYIKFKDSSGKESGGVSQTIDSTGTEIIDYTKINGGDMYTNSENVTVNFKGDSIYGYNIDGIENVKCGPVSLSTDGGQTWGQQENYSASDWSTPCTLPIGDGIKYINIYGSISTVSAGDLIIATTISIILDKTPPSIKNVSVTPQAWTNQAIVTANFSDATSGVAKKLYAPGMKDISYFKTAGAAVQTINGNSFSVNANGEYSIYAEDGAGNGTVQVVDVNGIGMAMVKFLGGNGSENVNVNNLVINSYGSSGYEFKLPNTVKDNIVKAVNDTKASEAVISVESKSIDVTFPEISSITDADLENGITVLVTVGANNNISPGQYIAILKMTPGSTDSNFDLTFSNINPTVASFDKYTSSSNYKDIPVTMTLKGNTLSSIYNGISKLTSGTDYTVSGDTVTISKAYLAKQTAGTTVLTFNFSAGNSQTLSITVEDTTPVETKGTGTVVDETGKAVKTIDTEITTEADKTRMLSVKAQDILLVKEPDGTESPISDLSKIGFSSEGNAGVSISQDGTIKITNLKDSTDSKIDVTFDMGNGQKIIIGTIDVKVSQNGDVSLASSLIDPYGIITDVSTGKVISGANVTLYYADTARNKASGKTTGTAVKLPVIAGFKPADNSNPQTSDSNGAYGFMVYPDTDYYIEADKSGYDKYTSTTISVDKTIVKYSFRMNAASSSSSGGSGGSGGGTPSPAKEDIERLWGQSRIDTSLAIAKAAYKDKVSKVIIASGDNYPDALSGSILSYKFKGPVVLVRNNEDDEDKVLQYMKSNMNQDGTVYILGGSSSVEDGMEEKIVNAGFKNINRLKGSDRYETAAKIVDEAGVKEGTPVIIASGENYADALSISSAAAIKQYPVLMVKKDEIPDAIKNEISTIKPTKVFIMGMEGAVSEKVQDDISKLAKIDSKDIVRIGGQNRFDTSLKAAQYFNSQGNKVCIASGNDFADALSGSSYAANMGEPIILVNNSLTDDEKSFLQGMKLKGASILGGIGAVSSEIEDEVSKLISK
ncbi:cell wall-binding repeat-containing protein [Clostridium ljungdahlii]|uniref:N-acetylmuramoyl-L-alanine amidase LytC n=1 Tax=Clostridium ljungdahlii (strain ATCC 55383 / DSM 13528 / PETC) TaxID=748727 RepID=D8GN48_CLOLD|nr:cell wall-binding repeat-containing protein [Clostridium ljungdahlii]ADK13672.1 predicted cell wall binding protein [Clostridium ljungdahlii DSM 13528]OAA84502.1 N-acetylmuramoyl-L-alanine amidase LytC precursor [Clostridium ljungdahlii DSM 13528]